MLFKIPIQFANTSSPQIYIHYNWFFLHAILRLLLILCILLPVFSLIRNGESGSSGTRPTTPSRVPLIRKILSNVLKAISFTLQDSILLIVMMDTPALSANSCWEKQQLSRIALTLLHISLTILSSENSYIVYVSYNFFIEENIFKYHFWYKNIDKLEKHQIYKHFLTCNLFF